jgi:hypothetical protein
VHQDDWGTVRRVDLRLEIDHLRLAAVPLQGSGQAIGPAQACNVALKCATFITTLLQKGSGWQMGRGKPLRATPQCNSRQMVRPRPVSPSSARYCTPPHGTCATANSILPCRRKGFLHKGLSHLSRRLPNASISYSGCAPVTSQSFLTAAWIERGPKYMRPTLAMLHPCPTVRRAAAGAHPCSAPREVKAKVCAGVRATQENAASASASA